MNRSLVVLFSLLGIVLFSMEVYSQGESLNPTPGLTQSPTPGMTQSPTPGMTKSPTPGMTHSPTPGMTQSPTPGMTHLPSPPLKQIPQRGTPTIITNQNCEGDTSPCGDSCFNPSLGESCDDGVIIAPQQ